MARKSKFKSDISEAIHSSAAMLYNVGALDKATMRDFDARHLVVPSTIEPAQIKQIRESINVSQPVFARYLDTSESTVEKGSPEEVRVHDFVPELGRAVPYGVYDIAGNAGWVSVGIDHDTAAFAINAIRAGTS